MKRKAILVVAALLMVVSGIAAVSAYEAHTINVKAHVENALDVDIAAIDFGTVFPQEVRIQYREIALSDSANQTLGTEPGQLTSVTYAVYAEYKVKDDTGTPIIYYKWLGEWLWVGPAPASSSSPIDGLVQVGVEPDPGYDPEPDPAKMAKIVPGAGNTLTDDTPDTLMVTLLTPCFKGSYNQYTDTKPTWWPTPDTAAWPLLVGNPAGTDLGLDLKIQVTAITRVGP